MFRQLSELRGKKTLLLLEHSLTTLSDWLKTLALDFQTMRGKTKTNRTLYAHLFSRALSTLQASLIGSSRCLLLL